MDKLSEDLTRSFVMYGCAFPLIVSLNVLTFTLLALAIHKLTGLF